MKNHIIRLFTSKETVGVLSLAVFTESCNPSGFFLGYCLVYACCDGVIFGLYDRWCHEDSDPKYEQVRRIDIEYF